MNESNFDFESKIDEFISRIKMSQGPGNNAAHNATEDLKKAKKDLKKGDYKWVGKRLSSAKDWLEQAGIDDMAKEIKVVINKLKKTHLESSNSDIGINSLVERIDSFINMNKSQEFRRELLGEAKGKVHWNLTIEDAIARTIGAKVSEGIAKKLKRKIKTDAKVKSKVSGDAGLIIVKPDSPSQAFREEFGGSIRLEVFLRLRRDGLAAVVRNMDTLDDVANTEVKGTEKIERLSLGVSSKVVEYVNSGLS